MPPAPAEGGERLLRRTLGLAAAAAAGTWLAWNAVWLTRGRLPPSMLSHFTGIPVATTGFTRSLLAAAAGRWSDSLAWNPFTAAFLALLAASGAVLLAAALGRRRLLLPLPLARAWLGVLAAAWVVKAVQGPRWW